MDITQLPVATTIDPVNDTFPIVTSSINTTQQINRDTLLTNYYDNGNQVFNIKAYGAVGDGVTDDTSKINACIAAASAGTVTATPSNGPSVTIPTAAVVTMLITAQQTLQITYANAPTWVVFGN
jgi:hypothetical protein